MRFFFCFLLILLLSIAACNNTPPMTPAETSIQLLSMHGLLGRSPGERSQSAKETLVSKQDLNEIFLDLDHYDKFTGELYTGVVIGALARHQSRLLESKNKTTASITAGHALIHFDLVDNTWKINLDKTIPKEMKQKARAEKKRYEAAKAAGQAAASTSGADF